MHATGHSFDSTTVSVSIVSVHYTIITNVCISECSIYIYIAMSALTLNTAQCVHAHAK